MESPPADLTQRRVRSSDENLTFTDGRHRLEEIIRLKNADFGPDDTDTLEAQFQLGQFLQDWGEYDAAAGVFQSLYGPVARQSSYADLEEAFELPMAAVTNVRLESLTCYLFCMDILAERDWVIPYDLINLVYSCTLTHPHLARYVVTGDRAKSFWKTSTLIWAARYGHSRLAGQLLEDGADKNARNKFGETAWKVADYSKFPGLRDVLEKPSKHRTTSESSNRHTTSIPPRSSLVVSPDTSTTSLRDRVKHLFRRRSPSASGGDSAAFIGEEHLPLSLPVLNSSERRQELA